MLAAAYGLCRRSPAPSWLLRATPIPLGLMRRHSSHECRRRLRQLIRAPLSTFRRNPHVRSLCARRKRHRSRRKVPQQALLTHPLPCRIWVRPGKRKQKGTARPKRARAPTRRLRARRPPPDAGHRAPKRLVLCVGKEPAEQGPTSWSLPPIPSPTRHRATSWRAHRAISLGQSIPRGRATEIKPVAGADAPGRHHARFREALRHDARRRLRHVGDRHLVIRRF